MARSRRKHVLRPPRRRLTRLGLAASAVLALGAPAAAVVWSGAEPPAATPVPHTKSDRARTSAVSMRVATPANTEDLVELVASPEADPERRTGATVELRARPSGKARPVDGLESSSAVEATGRTKGQWTEVVVENKRVWVRNTTVSEAEASTTASAEKGAAGTRTTQRTDREPDGSGAVTVSKTTAKTGSAPQPTATTPAAAPTAATTSAPASQPAADATSEPTASTVQEPTPEPTPVPASTSSTDPTDTLAEECDLTVSGRAVGLRRQLCQLPQ